MAELQIGEFATEIHEVGSGPTVILCHGSASDRRTWDSQAEALAANGYRAVSYSRRYHWPNEPADDDTQYSMSEHVEDLAALIRTVSVGSAGTEPAHIVGHSYGGFVALLVAVRQPEIVRSLTMIEPPFVSRFLSDPPKPSELVRVLLRHPRLALALVKFGATGVVPATKAAQRGEMDAAIEAFGTAVLGDDAFERLSAERMEQVKANNIRAEYLSDIFDPLSDEDLRSVVAPTLIVSGAASPTLWPLLADYASARISNSRRVEISGASHIVHEDRPEVFNEHLVEFLATIAG